MFGDVILIDFDLGRLMKRTIRLEARMGRGAEI